MEETLQYLDPNSYFPSQTPLKIFHHNDLKSQAKELIEAFKSYDLKNHFGIFSSGTSAGGLKGYVHSIEALEANARAVNSFFKLTEVDTWALSLPDYHIGGLQVLLRAKLAGAKVVDARGWDPSKWIKTLHETRVRITSIVPTQLYDLVRLELPPPTGLRLLIVGGDFLSIGLEKKAKELGWPVIRTFGMTEAASQIASSSIEGSSLQVLPIHEVKTSENNVLLIRSPALFSYFFKEANDWIIKPIEDFLDTAGFYRTQDEVRLNGSHLIPLGRSGDEFKSGGHLIRLGNLRETLQNFLLKESLFGKAEIYLTEDERKGKNIILLHEKLDEEILAKIQDAFLPVKIDRLQSVEKIDRTALGKAIRL